MEFRATTPEDLAYVAEHSVSRGIQKHAPDQTEFCYTLEHEGVPLCIGGFQLINLRTAWCWVDMTDESSKYIAVAYRTIRDWIDIFIREHDIKRLQAYVECDFTEAIRMVQHLGFKKESIMKNFMGDRDAFMYVRII